MFFENSRVPRALSVVSPINIGAITLGPFIFVSGTATDTLKNHELIHWEQHKECLILGFFLLYVLFYFKNLLVGLDRVSAYYEIPFEKEAYANDENLEYIKVRKRFSWREHIT